MDAFNKCMERVQEFGQLEVRKLPGGCHAEVSYNGTTVDIEIDFCSGNLAVILPNGFRQNKNVPRIFQFTDSDIDFKPLK